MSCLPVQKYIISIRHPGVECIAAVYLSPTVADVNLLFAAPATCFLVNTALSPHTPQLNFPPSLQSNYSSPSSPFLKRAIFFSLLILEKPTCSYPALTLLKHCGGARRSKVAAKLRHRLRYRLCTSIFTASLRKRRGLSRYS